MDSGEDIELSRLELRFASARVSDARAVERLARSIDQCGQLIACIAIADAERLVLIDGYRRVAALRTLGRDTASVERWHCSVAEGLLTVLTRSRSRPFAAIEEALLLRELVSVFALSQREAARRSGRDVSWVQRRLQLVVALPDPLLDALRAGSLSSWAASRILAPLARANADHAKRLLCALQSAPLSTRELKTWFTHYQGAQHEMRERLIGHPRLLLDSLAARDQQREGERLGAGPEGAALSELRRLEARLRQARKSLSPLTVPVTEPLAAACARVSTLWRALHAEFTRLIDDDAERNQRCRAHLAGPGAKPSRDQPPAQALA